MASPLASDPKIYELIYQNAAAIPGYDRYQRYLAELPRQEDPLGFLARHEDVYWSVQAALESLHAKPGGRLKILEIGSGFGYLTYALRRAGHDCIGIDISDRAVAKARSDFGDFYAVAELQHHQDPEGSGYDVIVATELIEHVTSPSTFLAQAARLLRPQGAIILTTPNKELYPPSLAWHTDPAPVHLWWFSRTSLRRLAWQQGLRARFIDFRPFYQRPPVAMVGPTKPQTFDATGRVVFRDSAINGIARSLLARFPSMFKVLAALFLRRTSAHRRRDTLYSDSLSLCAVMSRDEAAGAGPAG